MNVGAPTSVQVFLADGGNSPADVDPTTGHGPEWGKAAPIGLLIVVLLCVAVYFLVKSMNRNLKKVPESFDPAAFDPAAKVAVSAGGMESTSGADSGAASAVSDDPGVVPAPPAGSDAAHGGGRTAE